MAKREDDPQFRGGGELNTLLGKGSEFEGKLTFEGTVRIDGKFSGEISTNDVLVIGEGAKVQAEINAGSVVVNGEVQGNIRAKTSIELHHPARVRGNLESPQLSIDKGVLFEVLEDGGHRKGCGAAALERDLFTNRALGPPPGVIRAVGPPFTWAPSSKGGSPRQTP